VKTSAKHFGLAVGP